MKRSTLMNFCRIDACLLFAIAFLAIVGLQPALAQEEPIAATDPAAAETTATTGDEAASTGETATEATAAAPPATTLDRIRARGSVRLGYRADARPFSYRHESGVAAGYSVALCGIIADEIKTELGLPSLAVEWVEVSLDDRFKDLQEGKVDLLCGADTATLTRRQHVSFSQAIFPGGIGAVMRSDASTRLRLVLEGRPAPNQPLWRGNPATALQHRTFSAVSGSTADTWLTGRITRLGILAAATPVESYDAGLGRVLDRSSDAFFGDRAILLDAVKRSGSANNLQVLDRQFTVEPIALTMARGDEDLRLLVDRTLSTLFAAGEFGDFYTEIFGEPDERTLLFFQMGALPQ